MKKLFLLLCLALPLRALAWGKEGHEIVAHLAFGLLSPATRIGVNRLLSDTAGVVGPELMVEASFWPDAIKRHPGTPVGIFADFKVRNAAGTHPFHYCNMAGDHYDAATDSTHGKSVVSAIERCKEVLKGSGFSREQKVEALKFLIHFVGDIHQPLHAGRKADKGGNGIHLAAFLNRHPAKGFNLHEAWDTLLIQSRSRDSERYAAAIRSGLSKSTIAAYGVEHGPVRWLEESHTLAMTAAYVDTSGRAIMAGESLRDDYVRRNLPIVEQQLAKAGVRLALLLNELVQPVR